MEAGALRAPAALNRISVTAPLLRLRSDEQLVALFRAGNDAAFGVIHDRYRQRLFAYSRQMLGGSRQDAEDALQDVFLRAYSSLRSNDRPLSLRAWLYRVAHNRCIDHLRRPTPPAADLFDTSRRPLHDPIDEAVRREDLRQLVADVRRLPEQQRSALLLREMDGLSYAELAEVLGVSMQAVKSLLVRARIGLVEAIEARDTACVEIRLNLADAFDRGVRASGLARRHLRDCEGCVAYRTQLRAVRHGLDVLGPGSSGPLAALLKLAGIGGAGSAGAAGAGGAGAASGGVLAAASTGTAAKVAAVVCCAALTAGGVQVGERIVESSGSSKAAPQTFSTGAAAREPVVAPACGDSGACSHRASPPRRRARSPPRPLPVPSRRPPGATPAAASRPQPPCLPSPRTRTASARSTPPPAAHRLPARTLRPTFRRPSRRPRRPTPRPRPPTAITPAARRLPIRRACPVPRAPDRSRAARAPHLAASRRAELNTVPTDRYAAELDHEAVLVRRGARSGLFSMVAVHSTVCGPALGGCRMWHYDDTRAAMRDVLRLSRAMTYKSAVAGLPLGGGKGIILAPDPSTPVVRGRRADALRDFGDTVAALGGDYVTAEDVGTSARDMEVIASVTSHVSGLSRRRGGSGDPSPWTALGVESAIGVCCERVFGSESLHGRTIVVAGLGHVGARVAKQCAIDGATLLVTDIDRSKRALTSALGARWIEPREALSTTADVYVPCALGGILDHDNIERLGAPIVAGAANNQLADDDVADLLAARGVLWAPDFVVNAGGIINISVELEPAGYDPRRARDRVVGIANTLRRIFDDAQAQGRSPLAAAMELAHTRLAEAAAAPRNPLA